MLLMVLFVAAASFQNAAVSFTDILVSMLKREKQTNARLTANHATPSSSRNQSPRSSTAESETRSSTATRTLLGQVGSAEERGGLPLAERHWAGSDPQQRHAWEERTRNNICKSDFFGDDSGVISFLCLMAWCHGVGI